MNSTPSDVIHICKPYDSTRTLCDRPAGSVAAIDYWQYGLGRGPYCQMCEEGAKWHNEREGDDA